MLSHRDALASVARDLGPLHDEDYLEGLLRRFAGRALLQKGERRGVVMRGRARPPRLIVVMLLLDWEHVGSVQKRCSVGTARTQPRGYQKRRLPRCGDRVLQLRRVAGTGARRGTRQPVDADAARIVST